jgi:diguanylate cyclase (GGDEF)-like protein
MLRKWNLPELVCDAVEAHHNPTPGPVEQREQFLAATLWASGAIADVFCGDIATRELEPVTQRCAAAVKLETDRLRDVLETLDAQLKETANLFSVDIGESVSYQELRDRAVAQLAVISVSSERERVEATNREQKAKSQLEELSHRAENLERRASTDPLTQIGNRAAFETGLAAAIESARGNEGSIGMIMIDLDHFKKLNDNHGHQAGDEALRRVGRLLAKISDETRTAARYGGEEFAMVVTDATARNLRELAEDIRKNIEKIRFEYNGQPLSFTASLGVAHVSYQYEVATAKEIVERADECLYDAKEGGRNRVEITF